MIFINANHLLGPFWKLHLSKGVCLFILNLDSSKFFQVRAQRNLMVHVFLLTSRELRIEWCLHLPYTIWYKQQLWDAFICHKLKCFHTISYNYKKRADLEMILTSSNTENIVNDLLFSKWWSLNEADEFILSRPVQHLLQPISFFHWNLFL